MSGLKLILEQNKLTGVNYKHWLRNLKIALIYEKVHYVLDTPAPTPLSDRSTRAEREARATWDRDCDVASCFLLASMDEVHQRKYEKMDIKAILEDAKDLYGEQSRVMRYDITRKLFHTKMPAGSSVGDHVLKLISLIGELAALGFNLEKEFCTDIILQSLPPTYGQFISNFNMNKLNPTLPELLNMLRVEESTKKANSAFVVASDSTSGFKPKKKIQKKKQAPKKKAGKGKGESNAKEKVSKENVECFYCHKKGHYKVECRKFLATQTSKPEAASASGIFVIENFLSLSSTTWVLDTGSGSHICNDLQGLRQSRKLAKGEMTLRVGNGALASAFAVGNYHLKLAGGKILILHDCYYIPNMLCNIVSVSLLNTEGYCFSIRNNSMDITLNHVVIGHGSLSNGIYVLDHNSVNFNVVNVVKRKTSEMNDTFLWHCRLGHINLERIGRLHKDGYLSPFNLENYETCHSCLQGKMTKIPFRNKGTRVLETLGLIHSDVCGPMSTHAMGGYSYFVTFTDDFSRYGYIYLMKQKSEVLEKFIEYKNEVEKQLEKQIKVLRSDRGGEYLSQDFLALLRENGILSQVTPPYTPQHNGVSERRNRTLLDMVRSMMSTAGLPRTFWGYALETATYLLNRVPSKSVSKTPLELWCARIPSYNHIKP